MRESKSSSHTLMPQTHLSASSDQKDQRAVKPNSKPCHPLDGQWQHAGQTAFPFLFLLAA